MMAVPLAASVLGTGLAWSGADFLLFALMLLAAVGVFELLLSKAAGRAYRLAAATAVGTGFLLVWVTLAVGIVGAEDNPANRLIPAVLAVAAGGSALARLRPPAMAWAMAATAATQLLLPVVARVAGWGWDWGASAFLAAGWLLSALLFHRAGGVDRKD